MPVHDMCTVCAQHTIGLDIVFNTSMVLLGDEAQVEARFSLCGDVVILTQDRCLVCAEHIVGSEIILDAPMELICDVGHVESHFGLFGDSVGVGAI